jgi:hypothetical protein
LGLLLWTSDAVNRTLTAGIATAEDGRIESYQDVIEFVDAGVPEDVLTRIKAKAATEWGGDYTMQLEYIKKQVKAFKSL